MAVPSTTEFVTEITNMLASEVSEQDLDLDCDKTLTSKSAEQPLSVTPHTKASITRRTKTKKTKLCIWSRKSPNKLYLFLYNLIMPFLVITTAAYFAFHFNLPFIFPSLGPTAFLHFAIPNKAPSSPKNTLIGHLIGIMAGSLSLQITGLYDHDAIFHEGVVFNRIFCASLSVSVTCSLMVLLNVAHPPAGATTLIVSLGILKTPKQLSIMMAAVLLITIEAFIMNRIWRKDAIYPWWNITKKEKERNPNDFSLLRGFSSFRLSKMNIKFNSLKKKMESLTVDTFVDCFSICSEIEDEEIMRKLIEFAIYNRDALDARNDYFNLPYSVRFTVDNYAESV